VSDVELLERDVSTPIADEVVARVYGPLEPGDVVELPPTPGELSLLELDRTELYVELPSVGVLLAAPWPLEVLPAVETGPEDDRDSETVLTGRLELDKTEANPDEDLEPVFRLTKVLED
jgi:hypothetical protein